MVEVLNSEPCRESCLSRSNHLAKKKKRVKVILKTTSPLEGQYTKLATSVSCPLKEVLKHVYHLKEFNKKAKSTQMDLGFCLDAIRFLDSDSDFMHLQTT